MFSYQSFSQDSSKKAAYIATWSVAVVAVLLSLFLVAETAYTWAAKKQAEEQSYGPSISVRGTGKAVAIPNVATFTFGVQTTSESVETAQDDATKRTNAATDYLKAQGVDAKDIQTTSYDVYPHYEWVQEPCRQGQVCPQGRSVPVGFDVNQTVSVKVHDIKKAGELLAGIGKLQVTNISGLSFTVDDLEKVKDEARKLAVADAKKRAADMSSSLGVRLEKIQGMYDVDAGNGPYPMMADGYGGGAPMMAKEAVAPQVTPGQQEITVSVEIQYGIDN